MDPPNTKSALFQVYLRLRPPPTPPPITNQQQIYPTLPTPDRFLTVEEYTEDSSPTHITLNPPNDNRRRAVEKFAFTRVFEEECSQLDLFHGTGVLPLVEGVLGPSGGEGRDGLLATLGVTGSGKSHTILGSRNQRGLTQLALDVLFRSIDHNLLNNPNTINSLHAEIAASDPSEAQVLPAQMFLDTPPTFDPTSSRGSSRAQTPLVVRIPSNPFHPTNAKLYPTLPPVGGDGSPKSIRIVVHQDDDSSPGKKKTVPGQSTVSMHSLIPSFMQATATAARKYISTKTPQKGDSYQPTPRRTMPPKPLVFPTSPDISGITVDADPNAEYAILISMYEVYNDRIFDLLTPGIPSKSNKDFRRRPLLFKPTEQSPDRKVVAGLRKIICGNMKEALMVLEAGLIERRVAGTGSNSVSSRSHGFFCVEVKKRRRSRTPGPWVGSTLTIVDLAGSERARDAKTQGATLAEAGKINESLMYLGQCLQMQSDLGNNTKPNLVPFRQCKLTELLFSNSFPSANQNTPNHHRNPQKAIMIVTADPLGDFNATSQILRYSALAREITVPRIPSISATILGASQSSATSNPNFTSPTPPYFNHRATPQSPTDTERDTMEMAAMEISRMSEEIHGLRSELEKETNGRMELEAHLQTMEERMEERLLDMEMQVREECYKEMERRIGEEGRRWLVRLEEAGGREEEWRDRKVEVLVRGLGGGCACKDGADGDEDKENQIDEGLEDENERLRREITLLKRELNGKSPTKKGGRGVLRERKLGQMGGRVADDSEDVENGLGDSLSRLRVDDDTDLGLGDSIMVERGNSVVKEKSRKKDGGGAAAVVNGSPVKKVRKLTARKWGIDDEDL